MKLIIDHKKRSKFIIDKIKEAGEFRDCIIHEAESASDEGFSVSVLSNPPRLHLSFTSEYTAPPLKFSDLKAISNALGSDDIDVTKDSISQTGCETCDYGSLYGHTIVVSNVNEDLMLHLQNGFSKDCK